MADGETIIGAGDGLARSADVAGENLAKLAALFPGVVTEGASGPAVDVEALKDLVGEKPVEEGTAGGSPRFGLHWHGKADARRLALTPSAGTLRPAVEESVDWDTTQNLMIEGDNLEVLKLLQKGYRGRVKLIYIDPPYNTGKDFVYPDDFRESLKNYRELIAEPPKTNKDTTGRFHTDWLNMMYPRLMLARELLTEDGVIFVNLDDHEAHHVRNVLDDIFGGDNFLACFLWRKTDSPSRNEKDRVATPYHDYCIAYSKSDDDKQLHRHSKPDVIDAYPLRLEDGTPARRRQLRKNGKNAKRSDRPTLWYPLTAPDGTEVWPIAPPPEDWEGRWVLSKETWDERTSAGLTAWKERTHGWVPYYIETASENPEVPWSTWWDDLPQNRQAVAAFTALLDTRDSPFDNPKPIALLERIISIGTRGDDIIMDFFAGSGSTAHAVASLNAVDGGHRRSISIQLPEATGRDDYPTIAHLTRERLRRAGQKVQTDHPDWHGDTGFRCFRLDTSNVTAWAAPRARDADAEHIASLLEQAADPIAPDRSEQDLFFEVLLKHGLPGALSLPITADRVNCNGQTLTVRGVGGPYRGAVLACLDPAIEPGHVEPLAAALEAASAGWEGELLIVLRDSAFADDSTKLNLIEAVTQGFRRTDEDAGLPGARTPRVRTL